MLARYTRWLHTRWPAGTVEKLPDVREDGTTAVPGIRVVGDLTGIPLLKFSADTGAKAVHRILEEPDFQARRSTGQGEAERGNPDSEVRDLVIVGAGVSGISAAIEARKAGIDFVLFEATQNFSTIINFPKGKPIFTYPTDMVPAGDVQFTADIKEDLVDEIEAHRKAHGIESIHDRVERLERRGSEIVVHHAQGPTRALRVIIAIGRSGNFRKLNVPGEDLDKVYNRLHDPLEFTGRCALVVGGGDSAIETAIALSVAGAKVTLSYRRDELARAKPANIDKLHVLINDPTADVAVERPTSERVTTSFSRSMCGNSPPGTIQLALGTEVTEIRDREVDLKDKSGEVTTLPNEVVFSMIGREPPLDFFRRSGIPIRGEWRKRTFVTFSLFIVFCLWLYHWKSGGTKIPFTHFSVHDYFRDRGWFPFNVGGWFSSLTSAADQPTNFLYTLKTSMSGPSFYYTLAYCLCVVIFGIRRIRRRRTPYVKLQTIVLITIQCLPLFILPELILPWAGRNGAFESGSTIGSVADQFFEPYDDSGHERAYWRAYGFVLAWPLFVWNWFTEAPMWGWLIVGFLQTFVMIPLLIYYYGKGVYCGWICSCGALAETLGDTQRHKMPHGPFWSRMNMVGQAILAFALILFFVRIVAWIAPGSAATRIFDLFVAKLPVLNYKWSVDLMLAGVLGVGCYFWFSGRVWCRFACPLAALMHIYARFSRFRIFAEKKKCISCNVCTSVCHQGIDIMNFANKGLGMQDPECVRCSACVQSCPTGVLTFGRIAADGSPILDRLAASPVQMAERRSLASLPVVE